MTVAPLFATYLMVRYYLGLDVCSFGSVAVTLLWLLLAQLLVDLMASLVGSLFALPVALLRMNDTLAAVAIIPGTALVYGITLFILIYVVRDGATTLGAIDHSIGLARGNVLNLAALTTAILVIAELADMAVGVVVAADPWWLGAIPYTVSQVIYIGFLALAVAAQWELTHQPNDEAAAA